MRGSPTPARASTTTRAATSRCGSATASCTRVSPTHRATCSRAWSTRSRLTSAARPRRSSTSCSTPSAGADPPERDEPASRAWGMTPRADAGSVKDVLAGDGDRGLDAATAEDAPALTFRRAAPHAVVDAVRQRVLEALGLHGALRADAAGLVDTDAVGREELTGCEGPAASLEHPLLFAVIG